MLLFNYRGGLIMAKAYSMDLRKRIVAFVETGNTHRLAAEQFNVAISLVNTLMKRKRELGHIEVLPAGGKRHGKLDTVKDWLVKRVTEQKDITLFELRDELAEQGIEVAPSSIWRCLKHLGFSHKKNSVCYRKA